MVSTSAAQPLLAGRVAVPAAGGIPGHCHGGQEADGRSQEEPRVILSGALSFRTEQAPLRLSSQKFDSTKELSVTAPAPAASYPLGEGAYMTGAGKPQH